MAPTTILAQPVGRATADGSGALRLPIMTALVSLGVVLVALAYAQGRRSSGLATPLFWFGELCVFAPPLWLLLRRRAPTGWDACYSGLLVTAAFYVIKVAYSPLRFTFPDELQQWRGVLDAMHGGHLFNANYGLPVSQHYPGLQAATDAIASLTGLSAYVAGLVLAGVAHLLLIAAMYLLFDRIVHDARIAGLAVLLYTTNPHFQAFDAMFIYLGLAMPFLLVALLALQRLTSRQPTSDRRSWMLVVIVAISVVVVTHHVTSFVLAATLVLIAFVTLCVRESRESAGWAVAAAALSVLMVSLWTWLVAPDTWGYLRPAVKDIISGIASAFGSHGTASQSASLTSTPLPQRLGLAAFVLIAVALPIGSWVVMRSQRRSAWLIVLLIGSFVYYPLLGIRLTAGDATELTGRALTYVFIPSAVVIAIAFLHHWKQRLPFPQHARTIVAGAGALVLFLGCLVNGWPPSWERSPGPHQVASFERSVDREGIAAAEWMLHNLGPGNRVATDFGNQSLITAYGRQIPVMEVAQIFYSSKLRQQDIDLVAAMNPRYLLVDLRLSRSLPPSGFYFSNDPYAYKLTRPIPLTALTKFDHIKGVKRIYDSGDIIIYDLNGSAYEQ